MNQKEDFGLSDNVVKLIRDTQQLLRISSISPQDGGCMVFIEERLSSMGFQCQTFVLNGVTNLIASIGNAEKSVAFVGHTDVVPAGELEQWRFPPFAGQLSEGYLYGRGAADMKSGIACFLSAIEMYLSKHDASDTHIYVLITSDEEGEAEYGMRAIVDCLKQQELTLDACIVAEPSAASHTGDTIKVGRRGAISGTLTLEGKAGHVGYPHHIRNPVHKMGSVLHLLNAIEWDSGDDILSGTSLQVTHIHSGEFVDNISPGFCRIHFNIRYSHLWCENTLNTLIEKQISQVTSDYELHWERPCSPYHTDVSEGKSHVLPVLNDAILEVTGNKPSLSTSGGTSDGRFVATICPEVFEVGVSNQTIHQVNERVSVNDMTALRDIYVKFLQKYFS